MNDEAYEAMRTLLWELHFDHPNWLRENKKAMDAVTTLSNYLVGE